MTKTEIKNKFDEIVDFSGIEKFIDTPVKRYSSGMRVRLAFAVAAHLEPEILLIDEVLAVGDTEFQKKCIGKMGDIAGEGRTVLFVTHNMSALSSLCPRTVLLHKGEKKSDGDTKSIIQEYLSLNSTLGTEGRGEVLYENERSDDEQFVLHAVRTVDEKGRVRDAYNNTDPVIIELEFSLLNEIQNLVVGIELKRGFGEFVFRSFHNDIKEVLDINSIPKKKYRLRVIIPGGMLNGGPYNIYPCAGVHRKKWLVGGNNNIRGIAFNVSFNVPNKDYIYNDNKPGVLSPLLEWQQLKHNHSTLL